MVKLVLQVRATGASGRVLALEVLRVGGAVLTKSGQTEEDFLAEVQAWHEAIVRVEMGAADPKVTSLIPSVRSCLAVLERAGVRS
jgi:hypothetical protein